jgi:rhamnosyltransferase
MQSSFLTIIILYKPDIKVLQKNLNSLITQVDEIILINNGEKKDILGLNIYNCKLIHNKINEGISIVINKSLKYASINGFKYLLTLDQDSMLCENSIKNLLNGHLDNNVAIVCPSIIDSVTQRKDFVIQEFSDIEYTINSGSLINVEYALDIKGYDENFFIDMADFDFSLRLKNRNYKIKRSKNAIILHSLGVPIKINFLSYNFYVIDRNPERLFLISKNNILFLRKHFKHNINITIKFILMYIFSIIKIILFTNNKLLKIRMIFLGIKNGIT